MLVYNTITILHIYLCLYSLVREQDVRELHQADLSEVDPEENSAKFMGILIKVQSKPYMNITENDTRFTVNLNTSEMVKHFCSMLFCSGHYFSAVVVLCLNYDIHIIFIFQALAKLKKIPETIKAIMERLEPELKQIVKRSTTQIADHAYQRGENLAQESQPR